MSRMRVPCQDPPPHPRSKTHLMVRKAYPAFRALPEVAPAQAPCPQPGSLGWRHLPSSTCSQFLSLCMAPPSAPTLGRVLSPPQSPTPDSTALHGPCWVLEGPRDGPLSPQPGTASLFCSTDEFLSPSQACLLFHPPHPAPIHQPQFLLSTSFFLCSMVFLFYSSSFPWRILPLGLVNTHTHRLTC